MQEFAPTEIFHKHSVECADGNSRSDINYGYFPADNARLQKYGFSIGVTKDNARFIVDMTDPTSKNLTFVLTLTRNPQNRSVWSATLVKASNNITYKNRKFGFIFDVDQANIADANSENTVSGNKKNFDKFKKLLLDPSKTYVKDNLLNMLSEKGIKLNDEEYAKLSKYLMTKKYTTQITKNVKIGDKVIKAADLVECLEKSRDTLFENEDMQNEINPVNSRVMGLIAKVNSLEECPEDFLQFAHEHDLPIVIMKPSTEE